MRVRVIDRTSILGDAKLDAICCFTFEGAGKPAGVADASIRRALAARMRREGFDGGASDLLHWSDGNGRRWLLLGLGAADRLPLDEALRLGCARAAREAGSISVRRLALLLPERGGTVSISPEEAVRAAAEGVRLGAYRFDRHLTDEKRRVKPVDQVLLAVASSSRSLRRAAKLGLQGAEAVCRARDWVNEAPSRLNPADFARQTGRLASGELKRRVLQKTELGKLGMHALLAVARGSAVAPRVVHLTYKPKGKPSGRVVLVGKGVTFDSGGLDLKPSAAMLTMKSDMAGAGAVLATMSALRDVGCRAEVHGLVGLVENMTGGDAFKPGDILDTYAGKTVEVGNTDAEGRLVLCDLLAYAARRIKPDVMVDLATLTGACVVALGTRASGLFTRHDELGDALLAAGARAGEKIWPLPMYDEYLKEMQKGPADLCNIGGRWGGAITAALFLGEFVPRELPWAHLDIAGPAFTEAEIPEGPLGGTGAGVLALLRWLETL